MTLHERDRLGPYEIVGLLGRGGMGEVYRARDVRLGREVALKIIGETTREDPDSLARFTEEARVLAALSHPNIVAIHDFGSRDGVTFAVMELLVGETLRERLVRGPLPWRTALGIGTRVARGLAAAHGRRVVHRDLKPENIYLLAEGGVKVLDFGLAVLRPVEAEPATRQSERGFPGSKLYMAPEQICKQAVDSRTDIFALGVVLYEMLTTRRPFDRLTVGDTLAAIVREEPQPLDKNGPTVPEAISRVIWKCLAKDRSERYQDAFDLAFELSELLATPSAPEIARLSVRQRVLWLGLGALAGAALATLIALAV